MAYRKVLLCEQAILGFLHPGKHDISSYEVIQDAVPEDARIVNVRHGWPHSVELLIESESFTPVAEGQEIPVLYPLFRVNVSDTQAGRPIETGHLDRTNTKPIVLHGYKPLLSAASCTRD